MNASTFIDSINAITQHFLTIDWSRINTFEDLRLVGQHIEHTMFKATNHKNTHKGLLFLQLFLLYSYLKDILYSKLTDFISTFSQPLLDYQDKQTFRSTIYKSQGIKDVRTYPLTGFRQLLEILKKYHTFKNKHLHLSTANYHDYLSIVLIATFDDTTTIHRSNIDILNDVQTKARKIKNIYEQGEVEQVEHLAKKINVFYQQPNLTSGGVADLFTTLLTIDTIWRPYEKVIPTKNIQ